MSLAEIFPSTTSRTVGRTRSVTLASSHTAATSRTCSPVAEGIASSTSSTSSRSTRAGIAERSPSTGTSCRARPIFLGIIVDEPHRLQLDARGCPGCPSGPSTRRHRRRRAGPDAGVRGDRTPAQREQPALETDRAEPDERQHRTHDHDRPRHRLLPHPADGRVHADHETPADESSDRDPACLLDARVPPHLPVEPVDVVRGQVDEPDDGDEQPEVGPVLGRNARRRTAGRGGRGRPGSTTARSRSASGTLRRTRRDTDDAIPSWCLARRPCSIAMPNLPGCFEDPQHRQASCTPHQSRCVTSLRRTA